MISRNFLQDSLQTLLVGIGYKDLTELVLSHQANDVFHPSCIKFIKNIVQQEDGGNFCKLSDELKLGQFKRHKEGFLLPLRTTLFHTISTQLHTQVILMNSKGGVLDDAIFLKRSL